MEGRLIMVKIQSRQVRRRLAREEVKDVTRKISPFNGLNRRYRRHAEDTQNNVINTRACTKGRQIYYQRIYDIIDTKDKKILSFSSPHLIRFGYLPKDVSDKVFEIIWDKKKLVQKREIGKVVLVKTIKHIIPTEHYIKVQKLIIEQTLKRKG